MRIAAVADIHYRENWKESIRDLLQDVETQADLLLIAGDLTDTGLPAEADGLAEELRDISIPIVAVLGNHDHESDESEQIVKIVGDAGVCLLDGTVFEIDSVGFAGTKGFCGGFDDQFIQPFGERALKTFIQTSIEEAINLENALAKLDCQHKVILLHYSPIRETLSGEPLELYPFLGCSRLANAADRQKADVIVHGHAHHGSPSGRTKGGVQVYNVSRFVQNSHFHRNFCVFEL